jgi:hypothetical protein
MLSISTISSQPGELYVGCTKYQYIYHIYQELWIFFCNSSVDKPKARRSYVSDNALPVHLKPFGSQLST